MGLNTDEKIINDFTKKTIKSLPLELPSDSFTEMVMQRIDSKNSAEIYQPLITKKVFCIVFSAVLALMVISVWSPSLKYKWFNEMKFFNLTDVFSQFNVLSFSMSKTTLYTVIVCSIFVLAQVIILKQRHNKLFNS